MRRLAVVAAVVAATVLAAHLWHSHAASNAPAAPEPTPTVPAPRPVATAPAAAPTTPIPTPTPTAMAGPYGGTDKARREWEPVVQGFALAYPDTAGLTRKQWLANLRPYLDKNIVDALADTHLDQVPDGHYAGYQTLMVGDEAITVRVTYQEGWALVLYIAATGHGHWVVARFDNALDYD
jgi:hypothetical protein